jgi:hypothetical protein
MEMVGELKYNSNFYKFGEFPMTEIFKVCKVHGPLTKDQMYISPRNHLKNECLACKKERASKWHKEKRMLMKGESEEAKALRAAKNAKERGYRAANPEKYREMVQKSKRKNRDNIHKSEIKRLYGILPEEYDRMMKEQNGVCKICGKEETRKSRTPGKISKLAVDHDHKTGQIRALLCSDCNTGIGKLRDDPFLIDKAAAYLRSFGKT